MIPELGRPERVAGREGAEVRPVPAPSLRLMTPIDTPRLRLRLLEVSDAAAFRTAECRPENEPSWRLLERLGFRPDG